MSFPELLEAASALEKEQKLALHRLLNKVTEEEAYFALLP